MSFSSGTFSINTAGQPVVTGTVITSTAFNLLTADLATGLSTCVLKDGTQTMTANIPMSSFKLTGLGAGTAAGNSLRYEQLFNSAGNVPLPLRGYLSGLTLSTAGSSATMSIAAGQATDSTFVSMMFLSAFTKTTGAWTLGTGNGAMDTGSVANSTPYFWFLIQRTDTGVVDVLFSLSATAPTMPTNYTLFRRIGWGLTDGSAQWVLFSQSGDEFLWSVAVHNIAAQSITSTASSLALTVPLGIPVTVLYRAYFVDGTNASTALLLSSPSESDQAATVNAGGISLFTGSATGDATAGAFATRTTTQNIRARSSIAGASALLDINTYGWIDRRGRDA